MYKYQSRSYNQIQTLAGMNRQEGRSGKENNDWNLSPAGWKVQTRHSAVLLPRPSSHLSLSRVFTHQPLLLLIHRGRSHLSPMKGTGFPLFYLHRKKRFTSFPSPAGMSLTKLPLGRNNSVMTSLFPSMESLIVTSRLGRETRELFFYGVRTGQLPTSPVGNE